MKSFTVLYYKSKKKKHKSKGESKYDGTLTICPDRSIVSLLDEKDSIVFKSIQTDLAKRSCELQEDEIIQLGGHEIEILSILEDFSGGGGGAGAGAGHALSSSSSLGTSITNHRMTSSTMLSSSSSSSSLLGRKRGLGGLTSSSTTATAKKKTTVVGRAGLLLGGRGGTGGGLPSRQPAFMKRVPPPQPKRSITASVSRSVYDDSDEDADNDDDDNDWSSNNNNNITTTTKKSINPVRSKENPTLYNNIGSSNNSKSIIASNSSRLLATNKTNKTFRPVPRNYQNQQPQQGQSFASTNTTTTSDTYSRTSTATTTTDTNNNNDNIFSGAVGRLSVPHSIKSVLKPHQIDGLVFLWNNLSSSGGSGSSGKGTGMRGSMSGAILADEMGLGKTLQTIAVIAALHRRKRDRRFVVVTPSSLVNNWSAEFDKWMGKASEPKRVAVKKGGEDGVQQIKAFCAVKPNLSEVLIISYDLFRMNIGHLKSAKALELLVVDEGHRLKNTDGSKTMTALESLPVEARLCITATPIQNNLQDLYTLVNFVRPEFLGDLNTFRRVYERPISASGEKGCSADRKRKGADQSRELDRIVKTIMLRRLQKDTLKKILPPRHDFLLFCRPTKQQCSKYIEVTRQQDSISNISGSGASTDALTALMALRKLCAHPSLLRTSSDHPSNAGKMSAGIDISHSGKMMVLESLLREIRENAPDEKVVVVSNFTSTLSLIEDSILKKSPQNYPFLRLDGSVDAKTRQNIVDTFNLTPAAMNFALMLSSKSGGVGLNLIGANRLVVVDPDWNPSTDIQAMARIYRQGQKKQSFIYRLFTSGTVEEIICQRQIQKGGLVSMTVDADSGDDGEKTKSSQTSNTKFSAEEIRDCFTLKENCDSDTKRKLGSKWHGYGGKDDLIEQGCLDHVLLRMAEKDPSKSKLAFVHCVSDRDDDIDKGDNEESEDGSMNHEKDDRESEESSEEEFEFDE